MTLVGLIDEGQSLIVEGNGFGVELARAHDVAKRDPESRAYRPTRVAGEARLRWLAPSAPLAFQNGGIGAFADDTVDLHVALLLEVTDSVEGALSKGPIDGADRVSRTLQGLPEAS